MPVSAQQLRDAITVTLSTGDRFLFDPVKPNAAIRIIELARESLGDRDYVIEVLATLLAQPNLPASDFADWSDQQMQELTVGYLNLPANKGRRDDRATFTAQSLAECRHALQETVGADIDRLNESSRQVIDSLTKNAWKFGLTSPPITSPLFDVMRTSPLLQFEHIAQARAASFDQLTSGITSQLQQSVNRLIEQQAMLSKSLQQIVAPSIRSELLLGRIDFSHLMPVLDSWSLIQHSGIFKTLAQVQASRRAELLLEADLEFLNDLVDEAINQAIDEAAFKDRRHRQSYVGQRLRGVTASPAFWQQLEQTLTNSPRARRRLVVMTAAHSAHQARQYELSVPTLYTQVEGLLADCLCEAGQIRWSRKRRHWIVIDPVTGKDRQVIKKSKQRPDTVTGLDRLTVLANGEQSVAVAKTVAQVRDGIASDRNQVMHGTKTNYATARNSSRLLIVSLILARQLRHLEDATLQPVEDGTIANG